MDTPTRLARRRSRASKRGQRNVEHSAKPQPAGVGSLSPKPGKSGAKTRHVSAKAIWPTLDLLQRHQDPRHAARAQGDRRHPRSGI
jgi:hypothetical protein